MYPAFRTKQHDNAIASANGNNYEPLDNLARGCKQFVDWAQHVDGSDPSTFDAAAGQMHSINFFVSEAERSGNEKQKILAVLQEVREVQALSPFVKRLQTWPRGYQGDFETVEYLMESVNRAEPDSVAYWIEKYCLNTAVAQQHRNKVRWQAEHIERTINAGEKAGRPARILNLACGSSPDIRMCLERITDKEVHIVLNDMDGDALRFSSEKLVALGDRVKTVAGNMFRQINKFAAEGPFDLVLAGGLFDYLKDDQATFLVKAITSKLLAPTGKLLFTNISKPNPYKIWMEHCANWFLIERTEAHFRAMLDDIGVRSESLAIQTETSGLSLLIEIRGQVATKI